MSLLMKYIITCTSYEIKIFAELMNVLQSTSLLSPKSRKSSVSKKVKFTMTKQSVQFS